MGHPRVDEWLLQQIGRTRRCSPASDTSPEPLRSVCDSCHSVAVVSRAAPAAEAGAGDVNRRTGGTRLGQRRLTQHVTQRR